MHGFGVWASVSEGVWVFVWELKRWYTGTPGFGSQLLAELVHRDELFVAGPFPFRVVFRSGCRLSAVCWRWVDVQAKP